MFPPGKYEDVVCAGAGAPGADKLGAGAPDLDIFAGDWDGLDSHHDFFGSVDDGWDGLDSHHDFIGGVDDEEEAREDEEPSKGFVKVGADEDLDDEDVEGSLKAGGEALDDDLDVAWVGSQASCNTYLAYSANDNDICMYRNIF